MDYIKEEMKKPNYDFDSWCVRAPAMWTEVVEVVVVVEDQLVIEAIPVDGDLMDRDNPDHPQYHQICGYCGEVELGINEHIFIFEHDTKETIVTCCECGQDKFVCKELQDEGYTRDQETEEEEEEEE